ncbi:hypothetical protein THAOC_31445 [Thalassiosira oceanica]|uniref:Uncharacterized protein n=1 Tax=Thalassiosira oceanica TaxID=159749 RepID=K0R999_THAOC|nr:hypothetical protein THAOC_31445 [Thalassiosira oceanica]|eukprot:EJK49655.1 hypothetical protein THAOC_31445 [Thalassiosira oceanica]
MFGFSFPQQHQQTGGSAMKLAIASLYVGTVAALDEVTPSTRRKLTAPVAVGCFLQTSVTLSGSWSHLSPVNNNPVETCRTHCQPTGKPYMAFTCPGQMGKFYCSCLEESDFSSGTERPYYECRGECESVGSDPIANPECINRSTDGSRADTTDCVGLPYGATDFEGFIMGGGLRTMIYPIEDWIHPTGSPTASPTSPAPPTGSPSKSPTGSPAGSPSNSPTGSPTNVPTVSQGGAAAGHSTSGAATSSSAADSLYYPDWTKSNGGFKVGFNVEFDMGSYSMTLAPSTWMFATLDACCSRYYSWMLNDCKGTSGAAPSGLWYPGSYVSRLFFQIINLVSDRSPFADWTGPDDTCKNDGSEPQYMALNPVAWMHSSKQACCDANYGWMLNECLGSSAGATSKWFIDWDDFKCKRDCAVGTGASCGGRAELWDELFDTRSECCSNKAAWNPTDCLVD